MAPCITVRMPDSKLKGQFHLEKINIYTTKKCLKKIK